MKSLSSEIKRNFIGEEHFTELDNPFQMKPNFSTLGSVIEKSPQGPIICFVFGDSIRNFLEFHETIIYKENNLSSNHVDFYHFIIFSYKQI